MKKVLLTGQFVLLLIVHLAAQYQGGGGDGHGNAFLLAHLSGLTMPIYNGGGNDGADNELILSNLSGQTLSLYDGGIGHGSDVDWVNSTVGGQNMDVVYSGGFYDGHSSQQILSPLNGTALTLYDGGIGDGSDAAQKSFQLRIDCDPVIDLFQNQIESGSWKAADEINASVEIQPSAQVDFRSGGSINLFDGFYVNQTAIFEAIIQTCIPDPFSY